MRLLSLFFGIIFCISIISATPNMIIQKENYQSYETIIGEIDGVTNPISLENLKIYEDRREISFEKDISQQFNGKIYFYFIPTKEGNFTLKIMNILYQDESLKTISFEKNISVVDKKDNFSKREILTIKPGFIVESNQFLYIINSGDKNVSAKILNENYNLIVGEFKKIDVSKNNNNSLKIISYENFSVPLIYNPTIKTNLSENLTNNVSQTNFSESEINISIIPEKIDMKIIKDRLENFSFEINNFGDKLERISFVYDEKLISIDNINEIANGKSIISGKVKSTDDGFFYRNISLIKDEKEIGSLFLDIYVFPDNLTLSQVNVSLDKNCDYYNGTLCGNNQKCDGQFKYAGGLCCLTQCVDINQQENSTSNVLIGLAIILFVGILAFFIIKNAKKVRVAGAEDKFKRAEEVYNKRSK